MDYVPQHSGGHETRDTRVGPVVWAGIGLAVATALAALIAYGYFRYLAPSPPPLAPNPMASQQPPFPPEPRLEEHPTIELQQLRTEEDQRLNSYGWIDRKAGTVHIPIGRAIDLALQRGFPTRKEAKQ